MIQLLIAGMHRAQYLTQVRAALAKYHPDLYASHIESHDTTGLGMAKGIQTAWETALLFPWDYLLHVEEDMLPLAPLPLGMAITMWDYHPDVANIVFKREPWSHEEHVAGDVITASCAYDSDSHLALHQDGMALTIHSHIFSLNPCLIPRAIVERGWPAGNEAEMTAKLRADGYHFAFYGTVGDPPLVRHIGVERGEGWAL